MMGKKDYSERSQVQIASLDDLVPSGHLVQKLEEAIDDMENGRVQTVEEAWAEIDAV